MNLSESYDAMTPEQQTMEEIKAAAIQLINGPRDWGKSINNTLSDVVGAAIVKASKTKLASADFERLRSDVLKALRTPKTAS